MSFCRWSSDGFQCDLYCYESQDGFVTHVAASRHTKRVSDYDFSSAEAILESAKKREMELDDPENKLLPIGLPHDGETFIDNSLKDMLERVLWLKSLGYIVPDLVINAVMEEINEDNQDHL